MHLIHFQTWVSSLVLHYSLPPSPPPSPATGCRHLCASSNLWWGEGVRSHTFLLSLLSCSGERKGERFLLCLPTMRRGALYAGFDASQHNVARVLFVAEWNAGSPVSTNIGISGGLGGPFPLYTFPSWGIWFWLNHVSSDRFYEPQQHRVLDNQWFSKETQSPVPNTAEAEMVWTPSSFVSHVLGPYSHDFGFGLGDRDVFRRVVMKREIRFIS